MKFIQKALALVLILCSSSAMAADSGSLSAGKDYILLNPPQPTHSGKKIEVLEFFYYGCSHCFHLHPALSKWRDNLPKDVKLEFVPVSFGNPAQEVMAYTFYALQEMGKLDGKLDEALYTAWNVDNKPLYEQDIVADFVAQHGVNRADFVEHYGSFSVHSEVTRCKQMVLDYQIGGTPTLVVDGRYMVQNQFNPEDTIRNLNAIIDKVRRERGKHR